MPNYGRRGGGGPLLLRCGLVCGNGNVREARAGGGDAKRHDEHCPPTLRAARPVKGEVGSSSPRCRSVSALSSLHGSSNNRPPERRRTDSTDRPWNDGKDFSTALEMTEGFAPNGWKLCEIGWLPFSEKGRVGTFSRAFRSHPPPTTGGWPRCLWPQVEGRWSSKALPSAQDRRRGCEAAP